MSSLVHGTEKNRDTTALLDMASSLLTIKETPKREIAMKMITAFVQPSRLEHVRQALLAAEVVGMTVTECCGHGREPALVTSLRAGAETPDLQPTVMIEIAVPLHACETAIEAVVRGARIGTPGDGKIFISHLERVITIGNGLEDRDEIRADLPATPRKVHYSEQRQGVM